MALKIVQSKEVQDFLSKVCGFDQSGGDQRTKEIMRRLLNDLYQMIEDFDITPEEFWGAVNILNDLGRDHEFALLAPGLGFDHYLDLRMDAADEQSGLAGGTPRTIEGPLYVAGAPLSEGEARMDDGTENGEVMWLTGKVCDMTGKPIVGAIVDVWHANSKGGYSYFDTTQSAYNLRRRIKTDAEGRYCARSIVPSGYACPPEGPTQCVLNLLGRHGHRPAHIHFFIAAPGYRHLTTQINLAEDEYVRDDFAFATREELILPSWRIEDPVEAHKRGLDGPFTEVVFDISLVPTNEPERQERSKRLRALEVA
ncbi:MAG: catechol 1,2-dioxygenase [Hyphomicrobiales bacterium]|nr:catechol 1,2-dioxygenase [Hyphomicrobiales bacterium]